MDPKKSEGSTPPGSRRELGVRPRGASCEPPEDRGDFPEAERCFRQAIELRDGAGFFYPEAHTKHAQILLRRGERAGAEEEYRLVVLERPRHYAALVNLAEMLLQDPAKREEAIGLLERATAVRPDGFEAHGNLAQAYRLAGRREEAMRAIEAAARLRPEDPEVWELRSRILAEAGRSSEAEEAARQGRRLRTR